MPRGDARRIRNYLCRQVDAARQAGATMVTFRAGDVHDQLGLRNRHPNVCQVLEGGLFERQADVEFVRYLYRPPSGLGANLEIEFRLLPASGRSGERGLQAFPAGRSRTEYDEFRHVSVESVGKYDPLRRFLTEFDGNEWAATFDQIEQVLGFSLPASARKWRPWWANVENGPSQTRAWAAAGWKTRQVNLADETLVFVRTGRALLEFVEESSDATVSGAEGLGTLRLLDRAFVHAAAIEPERDLDGALLEFTPQSRYASATAMRLNRYGSGPFCRFFIEGLPRTSGVYVVTVDNVPVYVGVAVNLAKRWGPAGYAHISPRACYENGQSTNCKVNKYILRAARDGCRIDLWIHENPDPAPIEASLIRRLNPLWNDHRPRSPAIHESSEVAISPSRESHDPGPAASSRSRASPPSKGSGCLTALLLTGLPKFLRLLR